MAARGEVAAFGAAPLHPDEKSRIVEDAERMDVCAAAKKHGTNQSNVSRWCARARAQAEGSRVAGFSTARDETSEGRRETKEGRDETKSSLRAGAVRETGQDSRPSPRVAKKYTPTQIAEALEYAAAHGVSATSKKLGMSRFAIHAEFLAEWKRHPGLGPSQVRNQLRRKDVKVSIRRVRRVMEDAGYRPPRGSARSSTSASRRCARIICGTSTVSTASSTTPMLTP